MNAKKIAILGFLFFVFFESNNAVAQKDKKFRIDGEVTGLPKGSTVYLVKNKEIGGVDTVDQTKSDQFGRFFFKGELSCEGEGYFIKFDKIENWRTNSKTHDKYIRLILESKVISLKGDISDLSTLGLKITGSKANMEYKDYLTRANTFSIEMKQVTDSLVDRFRSQNLNMEGFQVAQRQLIFPILSQQKDMTKDWIRNNLGSYIAPWVVMKNAEDIEWMKRTWIKLPDSVKKSYYGRQLETVILQKQNTSIGAIAPNFEVQIDSGGRLTMKDIAANANYTVLYFWASWCSPCRASLPMIKEMYAHYRDKGLNIIGYSIDKSSEKWHAAIEEEGLSWYNVIEADLFSKFSYGVNEVPHYFILDRGGKIIAHYMDSKSVVDRIGSLMRDL